MSERWTQELERVKRRQKRKREKIEGGCEWQQNTSFIRRCDQQKKNICNLKQLGKWFSKRSKSADDELNVIEFDHALDCKCTTDQIKQKSRLKSQIALLNSRKSSPREHENGNKRSTGGVAEKEANWMKKERNVNDNAFELFRSNLVQVTHDSMHDFRSKQV